MSYKPATIQGLADGETGYVLDTGDLVAVSKRPSRDCMASHIAVTMKARWVNPDGSAVLDHGGQPVEWEHGYSAHQGGLADGTLTADAFMQGALDKVMQGGADGAAPEELHPDGGVRAKIAAVKVIKAALTQ